MAEPKLTLATGRRYDTKFLLDGVVKVRGFDIALRDSGPAPWPDFRDMVTTLSFDVGEQAFSHYLMAKDRGKPLTAIPVFPSRFFPHASLTVNRHSGIQEPFGLVGKRVGVAGFGFNPAAWMRGILQHQYEVPTEKIVWIEDTEDRFLAGLDYPRSRRFTIEKADQLNQRLEAGEIDAIIGPGGGGAPTENTRKLFEDPGVEVASYVKMTGVFPINTVMTLKEEAVQRNPELPAQLLNAFRETRLLYQQEVADGKETNHMGLDVSLLQELGLFPDAYGLEANRPAIRMMVHYCYEQGLIRKLYEPEELFAT